MSTNEKLLEGCDFLIRHRGEESVSGMVATALRERLIKERDGRVLVPKNPTLEMLEACEKAIEDGARYGWIISSRKIYETLLTAALAAAPKE